MLERHASRRRIVEATVQLEVDSFHDDHFQSETSSVFCEGKEEDSKMNSAKTTGSMVSSKQLLASTDSTVLSLTCSFLFLRSLLSVLPIDHLSPVFISIYPYFLYFLFLRAATSVAGQFFFSSLHNTSFFLFRKNTPSFCISRTSYFHYSVFLSLSFSLLSVHFRVLLKCILRRREHPRFHFTTPIIEIDLTLNWGIFYPSEAEDSTFCPSVCEIHVSRRIV